MKSDLGTVIALGLLSPSSISVVLAGTQQAELVCENIWRHDSKIKNVILVLPVPDTQISSIVGFPDDQEALVKFVTH